MAKAKNKMESVNLEVIDNGYILYINRSNSNIRKVFLKATDACEGMEEELLAEVRKAILE